MGDLPNRECCQAQLVRKKMKLSVFFVFGLRYLAEVVIITAVASILTLFTLQNIQSLQDNYNWKGSQPIPPQLKSNNLLSGTNIGIQSHWKAFLNPPQCESKPNCIARNDIVLQKLKIGILRPSEKERSIYLQSKGRFGNVLYQLAGLLAMSKATCSSIKVYSYYNFSVIFEDLPVIHLTKDEFNR